MSAPELLPGVPLDLPPGQNPNAVAIFAHGFGDTNDGILAWALGHELPRAGIAVAHVPLSERVVDNDVLTVPLSEQAARFSQALLAAAEQFPELPCHGLGHSQGCLSVAKTLLKSETSSGTAVLLAPPLTGPQGRFEQLWHRDIASLPPEMVAAGLVGYVNMPSDDRIMRRVGITADYWREALEHQPLPIIADLYAQHPTKLIFAGQDETLGNQLAQIMELPASPISSIDILDDADHYFAKRGGRRKVARLIIAALGLQQTA